MRQNYCFNDLFGHYVTLTLSYFNLTNSSVWIFWNIQGTPNEQKGMGISDKSCQNKECAKFSETDNNTQKSNTNESKVIEVFIFHMFLSDIYGY